jgi:hypothetical protein
MFFSIIGRFSGGDNGTASQRIGSTAQHNSLQGACGSQAVNPGSVQASSQPRMQKLT